MELHAVSGHAPLSTSLEAQQTLARASEADGCSGTSLYKSRLLRRLRLEDYLSPGLGDQLGEHSKTLSQILPPPLCAYVGA